MKTRITCLALWCIAASPGALLASPDADQKIADAAKESYNFHAVLEDRVAVSVHDGRVTLTGTVDDEDDKALAEATVENLPGVTGVKNEIVVKPAHPRRSDAWIALKIRGRLLVKANVSASTTKVMVKDGVVTLQGTADNAIQKERTGIHAGEIDGVKSVRNDIVVKDRPPLGERLADKMDDASITTQVKFALLRHKATSALKTKVKTTDGVVVVTGEAASDSEKSLVTKLAQDIRGVKSVENNMTVAK